MLLAIHKGKSFHLAHGWEYPKYTQETRSRVYIDKLGAYVGEIEGWPEFTIKNNNLQETINGLLELWMTAIEMK